MYTRLDGLSQYYVLFIKKDARQIHQIIYRISLLSIVGKIFTKLLKNRFVRWEEDNGLQYEEQAGYKKGYSTIDNMFTLQSLVQKYISKEKGRYYVIFIDFSKAFDMIPHSLLWYKLSKSGIHGRTLNVLRDM